MLTINLSSARRLLKSSVSRASRVLLATSLVAGGLTTAWSQEPAAPPPPVTAGPQPLIHRVQAPNERLEMTANSSRIITLDQKIPDVQINNPDILKVTPISPNEIQLFAVKAGVTSVFLRTAENQIYTVDVIVYGDAQELTMLLRSQFPRSALTVVPLANSVIIGGYVDQPSHVNTIVRIAEDYYPNVINNINVGGSQQVLLKVKVYEVSRTKLRNLGVDFSAFATGGQYAVTSVSQLLTATGANPVAPAASGGQTLTLGVVNAGSNFFGLVEALRQDQLAKILAEPTLVTVSGRPAFFNAGGEIPIPVPQSLGTVSIQYRPYGTQIDFVPIVLGGGQIRLEVRPRISELDPATGTTINGTFVNGIKVREIETGVEMLAGQTLALGGLVQERVEATRRGIPLIMDVPYLGVLFSRKREQVNEIELLITVTPEFAAAMDPCEVPGCLPGTFTTSPSDRQLYFKNHIEVPKLCPPGQDMPNVHGPHGAPVGEPMPAQPLQPVPPQIPPRQEAVPPPPAQTRSGTARTNWGNLAMASDQQQRRAQPVVRAAAAPKLERVPAVTPSPTNSTGAPSQGLIGPAGYETPQP
ncbi:MAG: pilus assembly protein N-terminal domain-containing protein [Planctomycetaceae bacterium]|nr:pilus assembly protein N-terminal domain-containing protein [Planctomycetaceae bacterium]